MKKGGQLHLNRGMLAEYKPTVTFRLHSIAFDSSPKDTSVQMAMKGRVTLLKDHRNNRGLSDDLTIVSISLINSFQLGRKNLGFHGF